MDWDDLRFFLAVARRGTLSAAARDHDVTQPTVGRRIAAFERRLGAALFVRTADGFEPSRAGAQIVEHAGRMEQDALAAERQVAGRDAGLHGAVRVTASEWMITAVLAPAAAALGARHPQLVLELIADHRHLNLARREADIALRPRRFEHDAIVQRAVGRISLGLYASPRYLASRGAPRIGDGAGHVLSAMTDDVGDVARDWLDTALPRATRGLRTNGRDAMLALALAGAGLACLPRIVGDAQRGLERAATAPDAPTLWLGVHRDARATPRVREVARFIGDRVRASRL